MASSAAGTSGSSKPRSRCTGPGRPAAPRRGGHHLVGERHPVADLAGLDHDGAPGGRAEHLGLQVGGLVGPGAAQARRPVGREQQQRQAGVVGLQDGRVQVRHGGARRGHHGRRHRRVGGGAAERHEGGGALVVPHVQAHLPGALGGLERVGERGRARARAEHDVADAPREQGVHERGRRRRRGAAHRRVTSPPWEAPTSGPAAPRGSGAPARATTAAARVRRRARPAGRRPAPPSRRAAARRPAAAGAR